MRSLLDITSYSLFVLAAILLFLEHRKNYLNQRMADWLRAKWTTISRHPLRMQPHLALAWTIRQYAYLEGTANALLDWLIFSNGGVTLFANLLIGAFLLFWLPQMSLIDVFAQRYIVVPVVVFFVGGYLYFIAGNAAYARFLEYQKRIERCRRAEAAIPTRMGESVRNEQDVDLAALLRIFGEVGARAPSDQAVVLKAVGASIGLFVLFALIVFILVSAPSAILRLVLESPIYLGFLILWSCVLFNILWLMFFVFCAFFVFHVFTGQGRIESLPFYALWLSFSFALTLAAFLVGKEVVETSDVPATTQYLLVNASFDALTLITTYHMVLVMLHAKHWTLASAYFIGDIALAAAFAVASVYFGLLGTASALPVGQCLNLLVGLDASGSRYEFGPLFWAMHTTFLPTLAYLAVVFLASMGKIVVQVADWLVSYAMEDKKPVMLTAILINVLAGVIQLAASFIGE